MSMIPAPSVTAAGPRDAWKGSLTCTRNPMANTRREPTTIHPRRRREKCASPNILVKAPLNAARSAADDLASYGIIPGEPRSAQRGALIDLERVRRPTAIGYLGFAA